MKKTTKKPIESSEMDMREIQRLIELGEKKGLAEFEVEKAGVRIRVKYVRDASVVQYLPSGSLPGPVVGSPAPDVAGAGPAKPAAVQEEDKDLSFVKSPIVGTFYAAPDPNSPPFVKVGDRVKPGQVLCIVEAMKLMNEIESEVSGEIVKVLVENAQPVEYGEPLFAIRVS